MIQRSTLRQKDLERLVKAAENTRSLVRIDMKTLVATVFPSSEMTEGERNAVVTDFAPNGKDGLEERLPCWPAALRRKMAAAYCGLAPETFEKQLDVKNR